LEEVVAPGYFRSARDLLSAGDSVRLVQMRGALFNDPANSVAAWAEMLVTRVADDVESVIVSPVVSVEPPEKPEHTPLPPPEEEPPPERFVRVNNANVRPLNGGRYGVYEGRRKVAEVDTRGLADAIATGAAPVPR